MFQKLILALIITCCVFQASPVRADSEPIPRPIVTPSYHGSTYFMMLPGPVRYDLNNGDGIAFRVDDKGVQTELWRTSGWYAFKVYLSSNGKYLVRIGNWHRGREPGAEDLAVAFYEEGVELKSYSTAELVKDYSKIRRSLSHYTWQADGCNKKRLNHKNEFCIRTLDGIEYSFNAVTGDILSEKRIRE